MYFKENVGYVRQIAVRLVYYYAKSTGAFTRAIFTEVLMRTPVIKSGILAITYQYYEF